MALDLEGEFHAHNGPIFFITHKVSRRLRLDDQPINEATNALIEAVETCGGQYMERATRR